MKTRILHTRFWKDSFIRKLSAGEKLLYNYLLTNDKVNILFCYELDIDEMVFDLGLSKGTIVTGLEKLAKSGKVLMYKNWVYLGNAYKYERYTGELNEIAKTKFLTSLSKDVLDWYNKLQDRGIKGVYIPPITHNYKYIDKNNRVVKGKKEKIKGGVFDARTE